MVNARVVGCLKKGKKKLAIILLNTATYSNETYRWLQVCTCSECPSMFITLQTHLPMQCCNNFPGGYSFMFIEINRT